MIPIVTFAGLGLVFGSFINALVWRVHQQSKEQKPDDRRKFSIISGRSQCPNCHHELAAKDLIPVISWLFLRGRCRYCGEPISAQYPIVELATAGVFVGSYVFWPNGVYGIGDWLLLGTWLLSSVGLMALLVYDLKWMLLPNKILYPTLAIAAAGRFLYISTFSTAIIHSLWLLVLSIAIASGFFWLIFMLSGGRWIGYGDVRLGLVLGTILAKPQLAFLMIFVASILGCLITLPALFAKRKNLTSRIPFGPYLIVATWIVLFYGETLLDWYKNSFIH